MTGTGPEADRPRRELAGVIVTDIVGSTELRARLGDAGAEALRRSHEQLLRLLVARYGGRTVFWRGDGILATLPSVSAAVRAAIAIQRAVDRQNRRARQAAPLSVRVTVAGGEIGWSGAECAGAPVEDAIRLAASARGGAILGSREAIELLGSREAIRMTPAGEHAFAIQWEVAESVAARLGMPTALAEDGQPPYVGREAVRPSIREALAAVQRGRSGLISIQGEAGIGKTRLAAQLACEAFERGLPVLYGPSHEGLTIAYEPIARALRHWIECVDDLAFRLGPHAGELVRLVAELRGGGLELPPPTRADAETERRRLFEAVGEWFASASADEPLVVVLDSLHWASNATFELLQSVLPRLVDARVLLVTTHRPSDPRTIVLRDLAIASLGGDAVVCVDLHGLEAYEVADLTGRMSLEPVPPALAGALHLVTSGNPLHLTTLLRQRRADRTGPDLPATVRAALTETLERLGQGERRVLEAASVVGEEFDAALLPALLDPSAGAFDALEEAERHGLIRAVDRRALRYRFSHALLRDVVYGGIGAVRVARLHEAVGLALERQHAERTESGIPQLAHHFSAAAALGNRERAAKYVAQAAGRALEQYANEQAADLYAEAIRLLDEGSIARTHCDLAIGRGEALRRLGDPGYRQILIDAADRAEAIGDGTLMTRALLGTYRGAFSRALRVDREQVRRLERALELLGDDAPILRGRALALLAVELVWAEDRRASRAVSDEAVAVARKIDDAELLAEVLAHRQWTVYHPLADRIATTEELAVLALHSADPILRFEIASSETFTRIRAGDRGGLERAMATLRDLSGEIDQPLVRWWLLIREGTLALLEGRLDRADAMIEETRRLGARTGQPDASQQYTVQRFWLDYERETPGEARRRIEPLAKAFANLPIVGWPAIAMRCTDVDLIELARPIVAKLAELGLARLPVDQLWLWSLCQTAEAAVRVGERRLLEPLFETLLPCADEHANVLFGTLGSVSRYLGLLCASLDEAEKAEAFYRKAESANEAIGAPTWLARTRLDLAALRFQRHGLHDPVGREALERARDAALQLGLPVVTERADRIAAG